ncbi:MAG: TIGR01777 family oxidoreductase, partial [Gemmatimonadota bacterium]
MTRFERSISINASADQVLRWHERPGAFERLAPPWQRIHIISRHGTIHEGDQLVMEMRLGPLHRRWTALHHAVPGRTGFEDEQVSGPFASWRHQHLIDPAGPRASILHDIIDYRLPVAAISEPLTGAIVERQLDRLFVYRHRTMLDDLASHSDYPPMRIVIAGASGFVGSHLVPFLTTGGHVVQQLVRRPAGPGEIQWDPARGQLDGALLEGVDAVINLAGENIATRWTQETKEKILQSRIRSTTLLAGTLAGLSRKPATFLSVSAIGFYGDRKDQSVDESSPPGQGFLPEVTRAWERAADEAEHAGIRVVHPRLGIILSPDGGALQKMLIPFRLGAGGRLGSGQQWMSWIALDDVLGAILHALTTPALAGPVNLTAPSPVTNA